MAADTKNKKAKTPPDVSTRCLPTMYTTYDDMTDVEVGDTLKLKFKKKTFRVKKEYVGRALDFTVLNYVDVDQGRRPERRLALVPLDKKDNYKEKDVLILANAERFDGLMIDLFPGNRRPYAGWDNKTVKAERDVRSVPPMS